MANQYVNKLVKDGVTKLDLTSDTVTSATLKSGYTAHNAAGQKITGTLLSQNTTATPDKIMKGYTAYNKAGTLITGTNEGKFFNLGLRADFKNSTFTRLGDAIGLNGGDGFDIFPMYKRRRCNLADDGTVNAYLGDENYAIDGSNGQVMVEQPKFYYKVVPVKLSDGGKQLDIAEYWISDKQLTGYKLHPAFYNTSGQEIDYFYESAYEAYLNNNKLCSISGVYPSDKISRSVARNYANNRGIGWKQETIWSLSADQLLMVIEYGKFNMQEAIGNGKVSQSSTSQTGLANSYGNKSYGTTENQTTTVQWRGKENPWGNSKTWVDGINFNVLTPFIANSYNFADATSDNYSQLSFNAPGYGFISRFGYDANYDWLFLPYSVGGSSAAPIGDSCKISNSSSMGWRTYMTTSKGEGLSGGAFYFDGTVKHDASYSYYGCRLLYVG